MNLVKNVGHTDRNIRYGAAGVLVLISIITGTWWPAVIGLILLATAYTGTCPAYKAFGVDTSKNDSN
jgi:hypothetical protein